MNLIEFDHGDLGKVFIANQEDSPEEWAMLAAMYSRSTMSAPEMIERVSKEGSGKFMETFYVGYGHESIGDLVDVKLFIEGIPLYLAPLIEHYALFRGQESSTRYIDFSKQRLYGPYQKLLQAQIDDYLNGLELVKEKLYSIHSPKTDVEKRAINARAFDIARGLIPLGATTNVAWYGDIRSIKGHLAWMAKNHPWSLPWVENIYEDLRAFIPKSCEKDLSEVRPRDPWIFDEGEGSVEFEGRIDFGSWRDLNRHRVGRQTFELPISDAMIHPFYTKMLDEAGWKGFVSKGTGYRGIEAEAFLAEHRSNFLLGQLVLFRYEMPYSQLEYFAWRRNQMDVHPTLRLLVQDLAINWGLVNERVPDIGWAYVLKRGNQTIIQSAGREK